VHCCWTRCVLASAIVPIDSVTVTSVGRRQQRARGNDRKSNTEHQLYQLSSYKCLKSYRQRMCDNSSSTAYNCDMDVMDIARSTVSESVNRNRICWESTEKPCCVVGNPNRESRTHHPVNQKEWDFSTFKRTQNWKKFLIWLLEAWL